ncbi:bifunctional 3-deoxy-7-phosphoheptulonate synthase/chorismate mutase type II [Candidatus Karelsulcia muelleri]|uniref:bifunctional 3-deoxy-7-phosphoheptulonate synthase/chorismate mutase type II n=1 Tax=Candidatus Karelsulcia muelleri TaxID=336810 RepID=UPI002167403A|nr:bifunctional 3-deoxy-7-phosphoheptulonate synthase/chorismate mutase type II [Candidatus Karelsulcia muelleri]
MKNIEQNWINSFKKPLIISGPCSAETENQVLETAKKLDKNYIQVFRAGIWKPRTRPNCFEGIGQIGLKWLNKVKKETGFLTATEVANSTHVELALKYDIDIIWIGARSTVNPFTVQEISEALKNTTKIILVKNPINPDLDLWIGALERLMNQGIKKIGVIHRGFSTYKSIKYRNTPNWGLALKFKKLYPNIPMLCDPSHISGNRECLFEVIKQAMSFKYEGLIVETHCNPDKALSDSQQQIRPEQFVEFLKNDFLKKTNSKTEMELEHIRVLISELDQNLIYLLSERMESSEKVAIIKKINNLLVFQPKRWKSLIEEYQTLGQKLCLSEKFLENIFQEIHKESINIQNKIINKI